MYKLCSILGDMSLAFEQDNNSLLAQAIERAEANQFVVHAARMRIVLAQRTGDCTQLERARAVLNALGITRTCARWKRWSRGSNS